MASLKDIKLHIVGVKQTQKLTKAMNMVAASKLRNTQSRTETFRAYADEYARLLSEMAGRAPAGAHPLLVPNNDAKKIGILAFSSDRGLCGSFNSNIFHALNKKLNQFTEEQLTPDLFLVGRKLRDFYQRRNYHISHAMVGVMGSFDFLLAHKIAEDLMEAYSKGEYRQIWMLYTKFHSLSKQEVILKPILPLCREVSGNVDGGEGVASLSSGGFDYLIEPNPEELFKRLIPRSLSILIFRAMLETATSENAARMQAMDNANRNCKEMIDTLTLSYNKARQASVTTELLDIVGGAEALNG